MLVYYAHCMAIYDTPQEQRDVELLNRLGFGVLNPNAKCYDDDFQWWLKAVKHVDAMSYWHGLVDTCDALAFRANHDGGIAAGVYSEVQYALRRNLPVFELPSSILCRGLTVDQTREFLREIGQR